MITRPDTLASSPDAGPHADLAAQLEARGPRLSLRALDRMYEDPFWWARFGERGRRFAEEDAGYHVTYLVGALRRGSDATLVDYARWLQRLLTTRGMCTRHVADDFGCLAAEITAAHGAGDAADGLRATTDVAPALAYLRAAQDALAYPSGPARALQDAASALVDAATASRPADERDPARVRHDASHLVSYLADAVALERPELFASHARWLAGFCAQQQGRAGDYVATLVLALDAALPNALDAASAQAARAVLAAATE